MNSPSRMTVPLARPTAPFASRLDRILRDVKRLRPLPASVTRTVRALEDPDTTARSVAELLSLDQALTAQVLRMANSAFLGYGPPSSSVPDAVMRLGFKRVKTMVLGAAASGPLRRRLSGYRLGDGELWRHSVAAASAALHVARAASYPDPEEAYTAGLLHDLGKLVLDQYVRVDYHVIAETVRRNKLQFWQVEEQIFGMDHGAVGGLMAANWHFPVALVDAIRCHHAPSLARTRPELAAIVNVANALTLNQNIGLTALGSGDIHPEALRILQLDRARLDRLQAELPEVLAGATREFAGTV